MSIVKYNNQDITPSPVITSLGQETMKTSSGKVIGYRYKLELSSVIVSTIGFEDLMTKKEALANLLSCPGHMLDIYCEEELLSSICVNDIILTFSETQDNWAQTISWKAQIDASEVSSFPSCPDIIHNLSSASDSWDIQKDAAYTSCRPVFIVSRNLSASAMEPCSTGEGSEEAWQVSKYWCESKLGNEIDTGVFPEYDCLGLESFNHTRVSKAEKYNGTYTVTDSWIATDVGGSGEDARGPYLESVDVVISESSSSAITSVAISGRIQGLDTRAFDEQGCTDPEGTEFYNAEQRWGVVQGGIHSSAELLSGLTLKPVPTSTRVTKTECVGLITYDYSYDNDTFCLTVPTGYTILNEKIDLSVTHPKDIYAETYVIGRPCPIIRDLGIKSKSTKTASIMVVLGLESGEDKCDRAAGEGACAIPAQSSVDEFLTNCYDDLVAEYDIVAVDADNESFNVSNGSYKRTVTWSYSNCCDDEAPQAFSFDNSETFAMESDTYQASFYQSLTITGADSGDEILLPRARNDIGKRINITNLSQVELGIGLSSFDSFGAGSLTSVDTGESVQAVVLTTNTWKVN